MSYGTDLQDASGTVAAGGTAQTALAGATSRQYLLVSNLDAAEVLFIAFGTTATAGAGSIVLAGNDRLEFGANSGPVPRGLVSVIAATTGHKYSVKHI